MMALSILNSCELNSYEPMVETTTCSSNSALDWFPSGWNWLLSASSNPGMDEPFNPPDVGAGNPDNGDDMRKTLIIATAAMLIGSSGLSFAGSSGTKGASDSAPGTQMNNSSAPTSRGASELSPGDRMKDSGTTGMSRGATKGASEYAPGDKMNDARIK
jgi:hypothetical protein